MVVLLVVLLLGVVILDLNGFLQFRRRQSKKERATGIGYSASLTKITEFHDFGTKFGLDRIFSFFFHIEGGCNAPTSPKPSF